MLALAAFGAGGQLARAIKKYYYGKADENVGGLVFLKRRLVNFLLESKWPKVYALESPSWDDYTFDLMGRVCTVANCTTSGFSLNTDRGGGTGRRW